MLWWWVATWVKESVPVPTVDSFSRVTTKTTKSTRRYAGYIQDRDKFVRIIYDYVVSQIGTGFSDEDLQKHTNFFKQHIIQQPKSYYRYDSSLEPDHWFDAVQVWEIKCADLSLSPVHRAAMGIVRNVLCTLPSKISS